MILIAQPHTGLPGVEKRLRPTPTNMHPLGNSSTSDAATEQHPLLFIQPSPPPYVLPTSSSDRSQPGGKRRTSRDVCRAACGITTAFIIGLTGALICIWLSWDSLVDIIGQRKGRLDQPPRPDASLGQVLTCDLRWFLSSKNGLPRLEIPDDAPTEREDVELITKKEDRGVPEFVLNEYIPSAVLDDDDDYGVSHGSRAFYAATMRFNLPALNFTEEEGSLLDSLFLFATGETPNGVIRIATTEQDEAAIDTKIQVDIVARFWNVEVLGQDTSVCVMRRGKELGIAFTGRKNLLDIRKLLWLDVTIGIPVKPGQGLELDTLVSDVPSFKLVVGLEDKVRFRSTRLHSGNAPITINSLTSTDVDIKTSNFPVKGVITAQKSAKIVTENSPLEVDLTTSGGDLQDPSVITLNTANNRLDAVVRLASSQPRGIDVRTTTSNGPMNVTIPYAPWGSHISYKGSTSNADGTIELPSAFAGTINLDGSKFSSFGATWNPDPTGLGYKVKVKVPRPNTYHVWYKSEEDLELGHVELHNKNGAALGMILGQDSSWRPPTDTALP